MDHAIFLLLISFYIGNCFSSSTCSWASPSSDSGGDDDDDAATGSKRKGSVRSKAPKRPSARVFSQILLPILLSFVCLPRTTTRRQILRKNPSRPSSLGLPSCMVHRPPVLILAHPDHQRARSQLSTSPMISCKSLSPTLA
ncbi:hypothetical protein K438DRAFT_118754 [Mycena galopus ATCC 62051]|nr:hypothetical protein K438DRAFT_118754 [Mycena galopus ATCC 62051]